MPIEAGAAGSTHDDAAFHVRSLHSRDAGAGALGIDLESATLGSATVRLTVRDDMTNALGTCHGGVVFTLADTAFQYACNSRGPVTVAAAASIDYVRPAFSGDVLTATCVERSRTRTGGLYDATVTRADSSGEKIIAIFRGRGHELGDSPLRAQE